jgi:hypothetical protein
MSVRKLLIFKIPQNLGRPADQSLSSRHAVYEE